MSSIEAAQALLGSDRTLDDQLEACAILASLNTPASIGLLLKTLHTDDPHVFDAAVQGLIQTGDKRTVNALINVLRTEDPWGIRHRITATALGILGSKDAIPVLTTLASSHHWHRVREAAAVALGKFRDSEATQALLGLLNDRDYAVQCAAATGLGQIGDKSATSALCDAMFKPDDWGLMQDAAIKALGMIKDPQAATSLVSLLKRPDNSTVVIDAVLNALVAIEKDVAGPLLSVLPQVEIPTQTAISRAFSLLDEPVLGKAFPHALHGEPAMLDEIVKLITTGDVRCVSALSDRLTSLRTSTSTTDAITQGLIEEALLDVFSTTATIQKGLFCRQDLTRFVAFSVEKTPYHACRTCGKTYFSIHAEHVIALLDTNAPVMTITDKSVVIVNGLKRNMLFDFDEVEIGVATDEEVVRFCVMIGNDADPFRTGRQTSCRIRNASRLNPNTIRILEKTFRSVQQD